MFFNGEPRHVGQLLIDLWPDHQRRRRLRHRRGGHDRRACSSAAAAAMIRYCGRRRRGSVRLSLNFSEGRFAGSAPRHHQFEPSHVSFALQLI